MKSKKRRAVTVLVIALALCALQAGLWVHSVSKDHSQTAEQNRIIQDPPLEFPGIAAVCLFIGTGIFLCGNQPTGD
ncbi:MAG TPA: hypothetical protein VJN93_04750 [Candidatus Acidoferrum sp.]|nr:hypothetical protein [Candidatus Acidoferrum sp.]